MKYYTLKILSIILFFGMVSCKDPLKKIISKETIGEVMSGVKEEKINVSEEAISMFEDIEEFSKSRNDFIEYLKGNSKEDTDFLLKYLVDEEEYKRETNIFFDFVEEKGITYKKITQEIDRAKEISEKYKPDILKEAKEIDRICVEIQEIIDESENFNSNIDNKLTLKVLGLEKTSYKGKKAVGIKVRAANGYKEPVYTVAFSVKVKDFDGNNITNFTANIDDQVKPSHTTTLIYSQNNIVEKLYGKSSYEFVYESKVHETNIDGTVYYPNIPSLNKIELPYGGQFSINSNYQSKNKPNGYCPYLNKGKTKYHNNVNKIRERMNDELVDEGYLFLKIYEDTKVFNYNK